MNATKLLILENSLGQKVRTFAVSSSALNLVYLKESRRIEGYSDISSLKDNNIEFTLIKKVDVTKIEDKGLELKGLGRLRALPESGVKNSPVYTLRDEDDKEDMKVILKKTGISHAVAVILLLGVSWVWSAYFVKSNEPALVTIEIPKEIEKPKKVVQTPPPKVKVSEKKIKQTHKVYKPKAQRTVVKRMPKVAPSKDVRRIGALAALGGLKNGTRGAEGLDLQSMKNIRAAGQGAGGGGIGTSGRGGARGYMPGSGLIAGSAGEGARAQGAGGYGTRGSGGGKAGYGKISLVGGMSAVSLPLDDEASVEGGLDRDQIAAVINRNRGQIVYCYEKGLKTQPGIGGRVSVSFVIGPAGRITRANVAESSLESSMVENCMVARMKSWQFPRPVGNVSVDVLYPFELSRVSSR